MVERIILLLALPANMPDAIPVTFAVPESLMGRSTTILEVREADNADAPLIPVWRSQVGPWVEKPLCALVPPPTSTGRPVRYILWAGGLSADRFTIQDVDDQKRLVFEDGKAVLAYNFGMVLADGVPEDRRRSCYVHPVFGLDGEVISGDFEKDHYHHRGLFWAWPNMTVWERSVSLWDLRGIQARFENWLGQDEGPIGGVFGVRNGWYVGEERVGQEDVWFRIWRATEVGRAIDVHLTFTATASPITLLGAAGKGYGGFCLRVRNVAGKTVTKPGGQTVTSSNEERLPWADLSGEFAGPGKVSGAAILIDPSNIGFPNGWCLRDYGFLGVNWPGVKPVTLEPGKPVTLKYRLWVHRGDVRTGLVAEAYGSFANPVEVSVAEE